MFRLHIYNPEHDIALGKNSENFTPPKAAVMTRRAYGHIPAFWAADGDWILVDDVSHAQRMLDSETRRHADVRFVCDKDLSRLRADEIPSEILPWGWDRLFVGRLLRCNPLFSSLVPDRQALDTVRRMSSREFAATEILPLLVASDNRLVGEARAIRTAEELDLFFGHVAKVAGSARFVLKSPWSCSGRGVRFVSGDVTDSLRGWCRNILEEQKSLMIEPYYDKVCDFAMEFMSDKADGTRCLGLNLFDTNNGAFVGNVVDTETDKLARLGRFVGEEVIDEVRRSIIDITSRLFYAKYAGPFGVDMMIVDIGGEYRVHPCVELNLRRTMGHAVL